MIDPTIFTAQGYVNPQCYAGAAAPATVINPQYLNAAGAAVKGTTTLTLEEQKALKNKGLNLFEITPEMVAKSHCNHVDPQTGDRAEIPNADGTVTCRICGATYTPDPTISTEDVSEAAKVATEILHNIKRYAYGVPVEFMRDIYTAQPILEKLPAIWDYLQKTLNNLAVDQQRIFGQQAAPGYFGQFNPWQMNPGYDPTLQSLINPQVNGNPYANPYTQAYPVGANPYANPYGNVAPMPTAGVTMPGVNPLYGTSLPTGEFVVPAPGTTAAPGTVPGVPTPPAAAPAAPNGGLFNFAAPTTPAAPAAAPVAPAATVATTPTLTTPPAPGAVPGVPTVGAPASINI